MWLVVCQGLYFALRIGPALRWDVNEMVGVLFLSICSLVVSTISLARGYKGKVASGLCSDIDNQHLFSFGVM